MNNNIMNIIGHGIVFRILLAFVLSLSTTLPLLPQEQNEANEYIEIQGLVNDIDTKKPIVFANIYVLGKSTGTVTNADGEFLLKIPKNESNVKIVVSHLGYASKTLTGSELKGTKIKVSLQPKLVQLKEIVVENIDPVELLTKALKNVPENYDNTPYKLDCFYRETVKQNNKYVFVGEALLDVYKSSYVSSTSFDRVKVFKGRKSHDVKKMDTIAFKLQGGPKTTFLLDVVKNPEMILSEDYFKYYNYSMSGIINFEDKECYVIDFQQKEEVLYPLYEGKIYLEKVGLAIAGLQFKLSDYGLLEAGDVLVRKKPLTMNVEPLSGSYLVKYRHMDGKWYLYYVRAEVSFKAKWKKKLFYKEFVTMSEMVVTDRKNTAVEKIKFKESSKLGDIFADDIKSFHNGDFWGSYNLIKPEESIEQAVKRFQKRKK